MEIKSPLICVFVSDVPIRFILHWVNCTHPVTEQTPVPQTTRIKTIKFHNTYLFSSSCITAWWWPELRVETTCRITTNYLQESWLWLWIFIDMVFAAPKERFHVQFKRNCALWAYLFQNVFSHRAAEIMHHNSWHSSDAQTDLLNTTLSFSAQKRSWVEITDGIFQKQ